MAHVEMQLLSRIIRTGCISQVVEWGLMEDDFRTTEGRGLYISILGYWHAVETRGAVPGPYLIKQYYPTFEFCDDPSMTVEALCAEVRRNRVAGEIRELMGNVIADVDVDPMAALQTLVHHSGRLQSIGMKTNDLHLSDGVEDLWQRYQRAKNGMAVGRVSWPWEPIEQQTMGIQDDDYIVLYGRPKSMKSFVLSEMAARAYDQGKNVLVYTKEMPAWQLFRRTAACIAHLPYNELRLGQLNEYHEQVFANLLEMVREQARATNGRHNITCISGRDAPAGQDSMSWVRSKMQKYHPDIVFIDGLYLMSSDKKVGRDHERVASISRAARDLVLEMGIPMVATMQANRKAAQHQNAELDEIAYSDAIGQDATVAMRVINEKQDAIVNGVKVPTIALVIAGSREFQLHGMRIGKMPCADFSFKQVMTEGDIAKATEKDNEGGEDEKKKDKKGELKRTPITTQGQRAPVNGITQEVQKSLDNVNETLNKLS